MAAPFVKLREDAELKSIPVVMLTAESSLCDAGLSCQLVPPQITRTSAFKLRAQNGGLAERTGFRGGDVEIFVDILVNPWND
jgi:hypothetical protein